MKSVKSKNLFLLVTFIVVAISIPVVVGSLFYKNTFLGLNQKQNLTISVPTQEFPVGAKISIVESFFSPGAVRFQRINKRYQIKQIGLYSDRHQDFAFFDHPIDYRESVLRFKASYPAGRTDKKSEFVVDEPGVYEITAIYTLDGKEIVSNGLVVVMLKE